MIFLRMFVFTDVLISALYKLFFSVEIKKELKKKTNFKFSEFLDSEQVKKYLNIWWQILMYIIRKIINN